MRGAGQRQDRGGELRLQTREPSTKSEAGKIGHSLLRSRWFAPRPQRVQSIGAPVLVVPKCLKWPIQILMFFVGLFSLLGTL